LRSKITARANDLYEALKLKFSAGGQGLSGAGSGGQGSELCAPGEGGGTPLALDDTERIKVLSPGRLVAKRFFRNRLAMVGFVTLIVMFVFAFLGPTIYPYSQTQLFYKYDYMNINYASAIERTENIPYAIPGAPALSNAVVNRFHSYILELEAAGAEEMTVTGADGGAYVIDRLGDRVFTLSTAQTSLVGQYFPSTQVATYDRFTDSFEWTGNALSNELKDALLALIAGSEVDLVFQGVSYALSLSRNKYTVTRLDPEFSGEMPGDGFVAAVEGSLDGEDFEFGGKTYRATDSGDGSFGVYEIGGVSAALVASTYVFNAFDVTRDFSNEFKANTLLAIHSGGSFTSGGASYSVAEDGGNLFVMDAAGNVAAELGIYSIRRYSGQDTLSIDFKETAQRVFEGMKESKASTGSFIYAIHEIDESGNFLYEEDGSPRNTEAEIMITRKPTGEFVMAVEQITYLIDIYGSPSGAHVFGTDADGMDILARMMYGGRISLMVGFVVVFLEICIGVVMGGIAGFFGKWVDTLIMRIVDVFFCIPTYPILIILGALFDKMKMDPYKRLMWMMVTLGLLGWAMVARLVRGQILSFREQEFMIAQEATGMRTSRRIFRHLVPNVMPQLIVVATMGVGSVIIYESTLSFLGLGVKHPLATWGTMIHSVTSAVESMINYTYIWIPVGLLICLTVIAFNFTGDGLRDAFDPKMRR